jgi:DNA-binding MarR family transcriptional regulator
MNEIHSAERSDSVSRQENVVRLWLRLLSCERSIEQRLRSHLSTNFGITLPQFEVLCELDRRDAPVVMSRLSEQLHVTSSNITGVVDRLERGGLVKRFRSSTDRRVQRIEMTPAGRSAFAEIEANSELWVTRVFTELTDREVVQLEKLLEKASLSASKALT